MGASRPGVDARGRPRWRLLTGQAGAPPVARAGRSVPRAYPREMQCAVRLADGRVVFVRPILPTDLPLLTEAIASADPETLRARFLGAPPTDPRVLQRLVEVDYQWRLALVAFDRAGRGVGIARYEGSSDRDDAEVAVVVDPAWRHVGLATALVELLGVAAVERGIRAFAAMYAASNLDVRRLVLNSGLHHRQETGAGVVEETVQLPQPPD